MLRAVRNTPLRRCLHTPAPAARQTRSRRLALAGAASAAAVTYIAWKATFQTNNIALDSHRQPTASSKSKPKSHVEPLEPTAEPELKAQISHPPEESDEPPEGEAGNEGEQESGASSAFNPDTGEINWDCPCLGGMAHGPCGPHFREAFSCFVFSEQDPKGIDCVEKFKAMQDCFREHPELYGEEIADDDDDDEQASAPSDPATPATTLTKEPPSQIPNTL